MIRYCSSCKMIITGLADSCPVCHSRLESIDPQKAKEALSAGEISKVKILSLEEIIRNRKKLASLRKYQSWPNTHWFNDGEYDKCLHTVERLLIFLNLAGVNSEKGDSGTPVVLVVERNRDNAWEYVCSDVNPQNIFSVIEDLYTKNIPFRVRKFYPGQNNEISRQ